MDIHRAKKIKWVKLKRLAKIKGKLEVAYEIEGVWSEPIVMGEPVRIAIKIRNGVPWDGLFETKNIVEASVTKVGYKFNDGNIQYKMETFDIEVGKNKLKNENN